MSIAKSIFSEDFRNRLNQARHAWGRRQYGRAIAVLAAYDAGQPTITREQQTHYNSNPNSVTAQVERVAMQFNGEYLAKNSPFGIGYLKQRINYCSPTGWQPQTGDRSLNSDLKSYLDQEFKHLGINCSLFEAFSRTANVEQPVRGDSGLIWYRDVDRLRLMEFSADQLGELYSFTNSQRISGFNYFAGIYFDASQSRAMYKVYERGNNQTYLNPHIYDGFDVIYFQDNLFRGVRGITAFHGTIVSLTKSDQLFQFGLDAAQKQAKIAVVHANQSGAPLYSDYEYERETVNGNVVLIEKNFDGAQTVYPYSGDDYELVQTTAPGSELIEGCRYADEKSCLSLGMPYSFLVNAESVNGAPSRLEIGKAGKEIERITRCQESKFEEIVYVLIMDAISRKKLSRAAIRNPLLTNGRVLFPNLPTADAFRETKDDIVSRRAGIDSRKRILGRYRENFDDILEDNKEEAMSIAMAVQDANKELEKRGYKPTVTAINIAQDVDNPQGEQSPDDQEKERLKAKTESESDNPSPARLSAFIGDFPVHSLPDDVQAAIQQTLGQGDHASKLVSKLGMTVPELVNMADQHNLETARNHVKRGTVKGYAQEVHSNATKHILVMNGRVVDGHHFLAKAEMGRVSKSLAVIDLSPVRFQTAVLARDVSQEKRDKNGRWTADNEAGRNESFDLTSVDHAVYPSQKRYEELLEKEELTPEETKEFSSMRKEINQKFGGYRDLIQEQYQMERELTQEQASLDDEISDFNENTPTEEVKKKTDRRALVTQLLAKLE